MNYGGEGREEGGRERRTNCDTLNHMGKLALPVVAAVAHVERHKTNTGENDD